MKNFFKKIFKWIGNLFFLMAMAIFLFTTLLYWNGEAELMSLLLAMAILLMFIFLKIYPYLNDGKRR
ncbi:hypothetical protein A9299_07630 [Moraxella osloensis]|uniref:Uncharacterized protein n=1 Tax=Faucicola osloensis TaxID=34062 RepID=A0AA91FS42_FAUOS|nr:hypothetical protein A9299_07630 [Moraxella osloensis]